MEVKINVLKFTREHVVLGIGLPGCARLEIDSSRKEGSLMACRERDDAEKTTVGFMGRSFEYSAGFSSTPGCKAERGHSPAP